uniref:Transposase-associated domain-containing protein n=1 Tax=Oryza glumipatula TaxID=40148 RepID=A0A0D9ZX32_9ORYZ
MGASAAAPPSPYSWWTLQDAASLPTTPPPRESERREWEEIEKRGASAATIPPRPYHRALPTYLRPDPEARIRPLPPRHPAVGDRSGGEGNRMGSGVRRGERKERNRWRRIAQDLAYFINAPHFIGRRADVLGPRLIADYDKSRRNNEYKSHLVHRGFMKNYTYWSKHGKRETLNIAVVEEADGQNKEQDLDNMFVSSPLVDTKL